MLMLTRIRLFLIDLAHRCASIAIILLAVDLGTVAYYQSRPFAITQTPIVHPFNPMKYLLASTFAAEEIALIAAVAAWLVSAHLRRRAADARGLALISACLALPTAAVILYPKLLAAI
jgi:hypothetical protein